MSEGILVNELSSLTFGIEEELILKFDFTIFIFSNNE